MNLPSAQEVSTKDAFVCGNYDCDVCSPTAFVEVDVQPYKAFCHFENTGSQSSLQGHECVSAESSVREQQLLRYL
jgi:hypothetical protein